jgi:superfamily II DNA or RNA helicase
MAKEKLILKDTIFKDYISTRGDKSKTIIVKHGHYVVRNYKMGDSPKLERMLSFFDRMYFRPVMIGGIYMKSFRELRIPRGFPFQMLCNMLPGYKPELNLKYFPYDSINVKLQIPPRSEIQKIAIAHMICAEPYTNLAKYTQQLITMDTGEGKSYSAVAAVCFQGAKAVVFCPTQKISKQWKDYFLQYTNMKEDDIVILKGAEMCKKVISGDIEAKVYVLVINTFVSLYNNNSLVLVEDFLKATRAKIKIMDEAHRNMDAMVKLDTIANFRINYYLTATSDRSDKNEDRIYQSLFKNVPKNDGMKLEEEAHINVIIKKYWLRVDSNAKRIMKTRMGLNAMLYEKYLMTHGGKEKSLFPEMAKICRWIDKHNPNNNKILLLTSTIEGIEKLTKFAQKVYPNKKITTYHSKLSKEEKADFANGDVIIATEKGAGYGVDIDKLQFMINIVTYSSKVGAKQFKGRLRRMQNGEEVYYFEMVNFDFPSTYKQYMNRKPFLAANSNKGIIVELD